MLTISLLTLGDPARLTGGYLYHRRIAEAAAAHDARVRFASFPPRPFPLPAMDAATVLRGSAEARADVLLLDSIAAAFLAPWLSRHRLEVPLAAIVHQPPGGIDHGRVRRRLQAALDESVYRRAQRLLLASDALAEDFAARGFERSLLRVVPPGRDVALPQPAGHLDLREGRRAALLSVGNWVPRKGLLDLLDAFTRLPDGLATLHLVGDAGTDPRYAQRVRARLGRRDLLGRVRVHGAVPRQRVATLYAAADVFVLASVKEPYGTVYGEAMAAGLPVVGWRAGNLPHLARDGHEGLVVPRGDVAALSGALWRLADDERYRDRLAVAARLRAQAFPTWADSAALLFAELRALTAETGPR